MRPDHDVIRVLGICGSERPRGNTDLLLEYAAERFASCHSIDMRIIHLRDENIVGPCGLGGDCNTRESVCAIDDGVNGIVQQMCQADGILYGLPVHGFGAAGVMQQFIERAGVGFLRFNRPLANKVAGILVTGRRFSLEAVHTQMVYNVLLNRMILAGSGFPALLRGGAPGSALKDKEGMRALMSTVDRMAGLIQYFREGRKAGLNEALLKFSEKMSDEITSDHVSRKGAR